MLAARTDGIVGAAIERVIDRLEQAYGRPRYVPRFTPMDELMSCILSQHSSDASSFPTFTRLCETYPSWADVANAPQPELADVIRAAGLANQKAKSIQGCLRAIESRFGDYTLEPLRKMPTKEALEWLRALPGVGPKTASIVMCFAFGREAIPVDTHVFRVSWRLGFIDRAIGELKAHDVLMERVPDQMAFRYHVTLIQHGRVRCRAPKPLCDGCPVRDACPFAKGEITGRDGS